MSGRKGLFFAFGAMVAVFAMLVGVFIGKSASRGNETLSGKQPVSPYPMPIVNQVVEEPIAFLQRWALTRAAVGTGASVVPFYADQVRFRGGGGMLASPGFIDRYWFGYAHRGGSLRFDWTTAEVTAEVIDARREVHSACAQGRSPDGQVTLVTVRHTIEDNADSQIALVGGGSCTHLEGPYLLRLLRTQNGFRICHESWSLRDAICASCPTAVSCSRDQPSVVPSAPSEPIVPTTFVHTCSRPGAYASLQDAMLPGTDFSDRSDLPAVIGEPPVALSMLSCAAEEFGMFAVFAHTPRGWVVTEVANNAISGRSDLRWDDAITLSGQRILVLRGDRHGAVANDSGTWLRYYVVANDGIVREVGTLDDDTADANQLHDGSCVTLIGRRRGRLCWDPVTRSMHR
jgi:hypothetical protein